MTHSNEQIIAYLQGKLTPQERTTLLEEAQHDEALRKAIMAQMETNALLFLHESQADVEEGRQQLRTFKTRLRHKRWLHAAKQSWRYAAVLLIGMLTMWFFLPKPAPTKPTLSMQTLHVPYGQHCQMTLPDGSKVWLNANTTLRFATPFVSERRLFLQGEALFEVAKNKQLPFVVTANGVNVEALGTRFHVKTLPERHSVCRFFGAVCRSIAPKRPKRVSSYCLIKALLPPTRALNASLSTTKSAHGKAESCRSNRLLWQLLFKNCNSIMV